MPFDTEDAMFNPPVSRRLSQYDLPMPNQDQTFLSSDIPNLGVSVFLDCYAYVYDHSFLLLGASTQAEVVVHSKRYHLP